MEGFINFPSLSHSISQIGLIMAISQEYRHLNMIIYVPSTKAKGGAAINFSGT